LGWGENQAAFGEPEPELEHEPEKEREEMHRTVRVWVMRVAAACVACAGVALAWGAWRLHAALPQRDGRLTVEGIRARVVIVRDVRGIAHIRANTEEDALFGEGFACAQDRLWQMDFLRRTAEGRLSEIVGPAALPVDRYMRTLGLARAAARDAGRLRGAAARDAAAYAAGVNAVMRRAQLPLEFILLGYRPTPWTVTDSIAIIKLMAQRLDDQWPRVELRALMQKRLGVKAADALLDMQVPARERFAASAHAAARRPATSKQAAAPVIADAHMPLPPEPGSGSNGWVVAGSKVTTGAPVLSNDTHLEHAVPSTYWLVQVTAPGLDVEGFIIPGIPFVALGHNRQIAFGVTSADEAVEDVYVERFRSPASDEYAVNGHWLRARHRRERIAVKGRRDVILDVLETRHGPVVARSGRMAYALAWPVLRAGAEVALLRRLDRARDWAGFEDALRLGVGPVFNWMYADRAGNIGYQMAGALPARRSGDGSLPVDGWDDRFAWRGSIAFEDLPHAFDPPGGYLGTANNQVAPVGQPGGSSPFFDAPLRVARIYRLLGQLPRMTPRQIGAIQGDVFDAARVILARRTAAVLRKDPDPRLRDLGRQLSVWNGIVSADSRIPTFLMREETEIGSLVLTPRLGAHLTQRYLKDNDAILPLERVLSEDGSLRTIGITRSSLLAALPVAARRAAAFSSAHRVGWSALIPWGHVNAALFTHPLGRFWPLTVLLNIAPFPQSGDGLTVYAAKPLHGPASRLVADLSNWDNSSMLLTLGESGIFNDPHYRDQVEAFRTVTWVQTPFSQAAVRAAAKDTLVLCPKKQATVRE
jgi:penicillin amidase